MQANSPEAIAALQRGAARGLRAVLQARHPDLTFDVSVPTEQPADLPISTGAPEEES